MVVLRQLKNHQKEKIMANFKKNSGFTLIELLVVVAIIVIICAVVFRACHGYEMGCYMTRGGTMASYETGLPCNWDCSWCMEPEQY
jgi:prepilin-type N-terminal cleavage/methylation domain-containing protein